MNEQMGHEHDLELIAALVEGRLDDPAGAEAQAAACPECGAHRDHLVVLAAVAADPSPGLDALERRRLRTAVWNEVSPPPRSASSRRGVPWPYRIASVAAALAVVVGLGAVLADRSGDEVAMVSFDQRDTATFDAEPDREGLAEEMRPLSETTIMTAAPEEAHDFDEADTFQVDSLEEVEEAATEFRRRAMESNRADVSPLAADCVAADTVADHPPFLSEEGAVGGETVEFVALGTTRHIEAVVVYRADDCAVIHREQ